MDQQKKQEMAAAVQLAMNAELEASSFYAKAAEVTADPRGRDMFAQLADFEKKHYRHLQNFFESMQGGEFAGYDGSAFAHVNPEKPSVDLSEHQIKSDIDAINLAVAAEKKAKSTYQDLADKAEDDKVRDFFAKLVEEEDLHRRILEDQFYALSNEGHWTWGE